jgi:heme-degrading monooxygenase HmoA
VTDPDAVNTPPAAEPGATEGRTVDGPVLEVAIIDVRDGTHEQFADAYRGVRPILAGTEGVRSIRMTHGVERPSRFVLLVEWDSVEAHRRNFRETERWEEWRAGIGPFFAHPPVVEHFTDVPEAGG